MFDAMITSKKISVNHILSYLYILIIGADFFCTKCQSAHRKNRAQKDPADFTDCPDCRL